MFREYFWYQSPSSLAIKLCDDNQIRNAKYFNDKFIDLRNAINKK